MRLLCLLLLWTSVLYAKEDEEKKFSLHKLFTEFKQYRTTFFYQHIFAIGRPVKLPCFQKGHGPKQGVHTYNWTHQGYLISDTSAFISAHLDSDGNLLISQILARKLTIWCTTLSGSLKALKPQNFAHRIDFYDPTFRQTLLAIDLKVNINQTERSNFAAFAFGQQFNCQVRSSEEPGPIPEKNEETEVAPQKRIMLQTVRDACSKSVDCIGVSLDFFRCSIDIDQLKALYSFDLSLLLTNDFGSILLADSKVSNVHEQNAEVGIPRLF
ncbi:unnamed protein product [Dibothriocephalus latus]|uniref:Uncharacterized protein n=1 Tax=Dibothriocephalus latus TaxID=60516 RepID=A0A3P7M3Z9_DIBLA|nr:unnamed protein product [Dibothriocephalus latus]